MSIVARFSSLPSRFAICIVLAVAAVVGSRSEAQTAPQLLPYTAKLIAGGGPTATYKAGSLCPVSGFVETDAYGDGCLANEIVLTSARYAVSDAVGNVFFSDYTNGLVRRVDAITGVVIAVAGGAASSPAAGAACGSFTSTDIFGDGCLGTAVKLSHPTGLAFDAKGDLFFSDLGYSTVREIAATSGSITTSGVITLVAGNTANTTSNFGYNVNNTATGGSVKAATQSYVNDPDGLAFDSAGNLYIADEGNNAVEVVNLTGASETVQGLTVPAGTIAKVIGYGSLSAKSARSGDCPSFVSTSSRGGCYFATVFTGTTGVTANIDGAYSVALDGANNLYVTNEFNANSGAVTTTNNIYNFTGQAGTAAEPKVTMRAAAGTFPLGSDFGIAADANSNVYISDASSGLIWRVDGPFSSSGGQSMYVVAGGVGNTGGPAAVCAGATDKYGDGCPALMAQLGSSGSKTTFFASTSGAGPGVYGISVDAYSDLFFGDTETALIREISSGTQFGVVGANQPTNNVDIHFATGDTPSTSVKAYQITTGSPNFSLGTATCTTNSDKTTDCLLPVTATPTVLGAFTGTLQVTSALGRVSNFALSGTYAQSPFTRTTLTYAAGVSCTGTTTYAASTPITLTANVIANGPAPPVGSADNITFYANNGTTNTAIGTVPVSNLGTSTAPSYGATLTYTFPATGTYTLTAVYSGDNYFKPSTGQAAATVTVATPSYSLAAISNMQSTVAQGQTALYSFTINQNVYSGTINFAVTGLPASSSYTISPTSVTATGCSGSSTVTLSILTTPLPPSNVASIGAAGHGPWALLSLFCGVALAFLIGLRRRMSTRLGQLCMVLALLVAASGLMACNTINVNAPAATPKGNYTITVTATGSAGGSGNVTFPLTVN